MCYPQLWLHVTFRVCFYYLYVILLVTTSKLKHIHIREKSDPVTTATVDDIKASIRGFQLSPVLPKAGSLNALNST